MRENKLNLKRFQLLLQNGENRDYLVVGSQAGETVAPCLYLEELLETEGVDFEPPDRVSINKSHSDRVNRFLDTDDIAHLTDREFARVLSVGLERLEGSTTIQSDETSITVDLIWNRSHTSAALRTITCGKGRRVGANAVRAVAGGETAPEDGRSPSTVVLVTNSQFTSGARELAD